MTLQLDMSDQQAEILVLALDHYIRTGIGQFEHVAEVYNRGGKLDADTYKAMREQLAAVKVVAGHPRNGGYGIHNSKVVNGFRVAHDIQQVVRHALAWKQKPEGGGGLYFDTPYSTSGEPLPEAKAK